MSQGTFIPAIHCGWRLQRGSWVKVHQSAFSTQWTIDYAGIVGTLWNNWLEFRLATNNLEAADFWQMQLVCMNDIKCSLLLLWHKQTRSTTQMSQASIQIHHVMPLWSDMWVHLILVLYVLYYEGLEIILFFPISEIPLLFQSAK